jgi:hypothetical protein
MRRLVLLSCFVPAYAFAQSAPSPAPAPAPIGEPTPTPAPGAEVKPAEPAPSPAPPQEPAQPYYQPPQPAYGAQPQRSLHEGITFEANLGLGWNRTSPEDQDGVTSDVGIGGLCVGVGHWLDPKLALTGRLAGATIFESGAQQNAIFLGPSAQYWVDDRFWLGGGLGFALLGATDTNGNRLDSNVGFGIDLRMGYTFNAGTLHTFNASLEINPGYFREDGMSAVITGIGILAGYQYL